MKLKYVLRLLRSKGTLIPTASCSQNLRPICTCRAWRYSKFTVLLSVFADLYAAFRLCSKMHHVELLPMMSPDDSDLLAKIWIRVISLFAHSSHVVCVYGSYGACNYYGPMRQISRFTIVSIRARVRHPCRSRTCRQQRQTFETQRTDILYFVFLHPRLHQKVRMNLRWSFSMLQGKRYYSRPSALSFYGAISLCANACAFGSMSRPYFDVT